MNKFFLKRKNKNKTKAVDEILFAKILARFLCVQLTVISCGIQTTLLKTLPLLRRCSHSPVHCSSLFLKIKTQNGTHPDHSKGSMFQSASTPAAFPLGIFMHSSRCLLPVSLHFSSLKILKNAHH